MPCFALPLLNSLQVTEVTRTTGTTDVSVGYTVDKDGSPLSATEAVTAAASISDQMMAIKLGYEVSSKAESKTSYNRDWSTGVTLVTVRSIYVYRANKEMHSVFIN